MGHGRLLWAAVMSAAAVTILGGYTAASALLAQPPAPAAVADVTDAVPETAPTPVPETPADALMVTVVDDTGVKGRKVVVHDEQGQALRLEAPNHLEEIRLELSPDNLYTLTSDDGLSTTFYLEANGSVTNVTGDGWSDGERLHLDTEVRCTLEVLGSAVGEASVCTLTGQGVTQTQVLYREEGRTTGRAVFSGLAPGTYTFQGSGVQRTVELSEEQPYVVLGLH